MKTRVEQIIDLLADELEQRLRQRQRAAVPPSSPTAVAAPATHESRPPKPPAQPEPQPTAEEAPPRPLGPPHAARLMLRLALALVVLIVAVNIPFNRFGTTLATMLPDTAAWVIVDGFVVKEEDDAEIYVFENDQMRWISSLEAFEAYGYDWGDVHVAPDGYLDQFEIGPDVYVLAKCYSSPHVYLLEGGEKRWIRDIETFAAQGYVWEDVQMYGCDLLRRIPDGETIPPGSGPPPT